MRKFVKYLLFFLLPLLIIGTLFEFSLRRVPNDYLYKSNYLDKNSESIEILFLGSSHTYYGINPIYIKPKSFNASYVSQYLNYDLAILRKYGDKWSNLKCIVVPVDYFSLYKTLESSPEKWRIKNYSLYYNISCETYNLFPTLAILNNSFKNNLKRAFGYYLSNVFDVEYITCSNLGWGTSFRTKSKEGLIATGVTAANRHFAKSDKYFRGNFNILQSIVEFAEEKNIKVLIFTSPAYETYVKSLDKNQLFNTINAVKFIAKNHKNTTYCNLLNDDRFREKDFFDADHLNEVGAKKLTFTINRLLDSIQVAANIKY